MGDDLRASFEFKVTLPSKLKITYTLQNEGRHSAVITGVALFDMTGTAQLHDPTKFVDSCDRVSTTAITMQQLMGNFIRFSIPPGLTGVIGRPKETDGPRQTPADHPVFVVDSGTTRIVTAIFELPPNEKETDIRIICPIVWTRDAKSVEGMAVCKGISSSWTLSDNLKPSAFNNFPGGQFRLLPHADFPSCPAI
jgi:hypothetical protein